MSSGARRWLGFGAAALAVYAPVLALSFLCDDFLTVRAAIERGPFDVIKLQSVFRPLPGASLWLDARLWHLWPVGYHVHNVLLHAVASVALLHIGLKLELPRAASLMAAIWFLVAPAHSETVTWIGCRTDVLSGALALLAVWAWLAAIEDRRRWRLALAVALLAAAMSCKESTPPIALLLGAWELRGARRAGDPRERAHALGRAALLGAMFVGYVIVRRLAIGEWLGCYGELHTQFTFAGVIGNLGLMTVRALTGRLPAELIPIGTRVDGLGAALAALRAHPVLAALGALVGMAAIALAVRAVERPGDRGPLAFLAAGYALMLLPVINLGISVSTFECERYLYLPSAMLFLLVAALACRLVERPRARTAGAVVIALVSLVALERALLDWHAAGRIESTLLSEIADASRARPITIVNLPDTLRGAYLWRNGLAEALALYHPGVAPPSFAVLHTISSPDEPVHVERTRDRDGVRLALANPRSRMIALRLPAGVTASEATDASGATRLELRGAWPTPLYRYSAGHLAPVAP